MVANRCGGAMFCPGIPEKIFEEIPLLDFLPSGKPGRSYFAYTSTTGKMVGSSGFEPLKAKSQQIYSLSPLAARATPQQLIRSGGLAPQASLVQKPAGGGRKPNAYDIPLDPEDLRLRTPTPAQNKLVEGFEPPTRCLQNSCSTPELHQH